MKEERRNIGIITFPMSESGSIPLSNLAAVLYSLSDKLYVITGNQGRVLSKGENDEIRVSCTHHRGGTNLITRVANYAYTQLKLSFRLAKLSKNVDVWIFFIGGEALVLPMLTAKSLRKDIIIASAGSGLKVDQVQNDPLARALAALQNITYRLSDRIIVYSERLIEEHGLQRYRSKVSIAHKHFLDFSKFKVEKAYDERDNVVGYVGALSKAKGIPNLLEAIEELLQSDDRIRFLLGGEGGLRSSIEQWSSRDNFCGRVRFVGWIPHDELPKYLNELRLLVLPSYAEGLPNIILEAMACGTPVLATPVGAIPDVIRDGETGFIMEDNSPECIARNVVRALNHPRLQEIAQNARALAEKEFTYEKAVERYRNILKPTLI